MRTFGVDGNNDLFITGRNLTIVTDRQAVLEVCEHVAKTILGEMVFAKNQGMPYFETVFVGGPSTAPFEAAFRTRILQVSGVVSIQSLQTEQVGDAMVYQAEIQTIYGVGAISG